MKIILKAKFFWFLFLASKHFSSEILISQIKFGPVLEKKNEILKDGYVKVSSSYDGSGAWPSSVPRPTRVWVRIIARGKEWKTDWLYQLFWTSGFEPGLETCLGGDFYTMEVAEV